MKREQYINNQYNIYEKECIEKDLTPKSRSEFKSMWAAGTIDRRNKVISGHKSLRQRILYATQYDTDYKVALNRKNQMRDYADMINSQLTKADNDTQKIDYDKLLSLKQLKSMNTAEYNKYLETELGLDPNKMYEDLWQYKVKQGMSEQEARKESAKWMSQNIYGSK